ncbi:MAG: sensor histidine kinase, partial [Flavobacteriales bacterium]|nr:sensor histidine kinase [Flavobacteriales bacterium]
VEDKGLGIPPEERELIFRKFYRMGSEDTRSAKGTGIGLYMVQQIVKLHRAKLILKQNKPQGAIFEIQFTTHEAIK